MAWRVQHVHKVALAACSRQDERHGHRTNRQAAFLLEHMRVSVPQRLFGVHLDAVRLFHQHVHKRGLAVRQMANDGHMADHIGELHHVQHKLPVKADFRQPLLFHGKDAHSLRLDDRLRQWLGVFLLHERLHIVTVHFGSRGVVHLVFVEHDRLGRGLIDMHDHSAFLLGAARVLCGRLRRWLGWFHTQYLLLILRL